MFIYGYTQKLLDLHDDKILLIQSINNIKKNDFIHIVMYPSYDLVRLITLHMICYMVL